MDAAERRNYIGYLVGSLQSFHSQITSRQQHLLLTSNYPFPPALVRTIKRSLVLLGKTYRFREVLVAEDGV